MWGSEFDRPKVRTVEVPLDLVGREKSKIGREDDICSYTRLGSTPMDVESSLI